MNEAWHPLQGKCLSAAPTGTLLWLQAFCRNNMCDGVREIFEADLRDIELELDRREIARLSAHETARNWPMN